MFQPTRNDPATFTLMDALWNSGTPEPELLEALSSDNWQVQMAALYAIGDRGLTSAIPGILDLLAQQNSLDLYGTPEHQNDAWRKIDNENKDVWRCRFRVKQAACLAFAKLAETHGSACLPKQALEILAKYAVSQDDDIQVRAAACQAIGRIGLAEPFIIKVLKQASLDGEWCTQTEAKKALKSLS